MDYYYLEHLREQHSGLALLRAQHLPLIASFLWETFRESGCARWDEVELSSRLGDCLFRLQNPEHAGEPAYYLSQWVKAGYLRQFYVEGDDLPRYELMPAVDKALHWLFTLKERRFVGTESRLKTIFELLSSLVEQSEKDIARRVEQLELQKQEIEDEISRAKCGEFSVLNATQIRERFNQLEDLARQLLRDFSEVEHNFREVDRGAREKIATLDGGRGEILEVIFKDTDLIRDSEQGRSFAAFFEFLMSSEFQASFETLLQRVYALDAVNSLPPDPFLGQVQFGMLEASERILGTQSRLSAQLRRFLDHRARLEQRRVAGLIREIEQHLIALREDRGSESIEVSLDLLSAGVTLLGRPLYANPVALSKIEEVSVGDGRQVDADPLFSNSHVDERKLALNVRSCLEHKPWVSLADVLAEYPVTEGVAELVSYLQLASRDAKATIDRDIETVLTVPGDSGVRQVRVPEVLFYR